MVDNFWGGQESDLPRFYESLREISSEVVKKSLQKIQAYAGNLPLGSMETNFGKVVQEFGNSEQMTVLEILIADQSLCNSWSTTKFSESLPGWWI